MENTPKYYSKPYPSSIGFSTLHKVTDTHIHTVIIFTDGYMNIYEYLASDIMAQSELKYCKEITQDEFVDQIIMLKKLL